VDSEAFWGPAERLLSSRFLGEILLRLEGLRVGCIVGEVEGLIKIL
jgi:hypothetical protein